MIFTISRSWLRTVILVIILTTTIRGVVSNGPDTCECGITVIGPLLGGVVIFVCNAYTYDGAVYENLEYRWLMTNSSGVSGEASKQLSSRKHPKLFTQNPDLGNYTCLVSGVGITIPYSCSVTLNKCDCDAENEHTPPPIEVIPHCEDSRAPHLHPSPNKDIVTVEMLGNLTLTCASSSYQAPENETEFDIELLPLDSYHFEYATETSTSNEMTTDSHSSMYDSDLSNPSLQTTDASEWSTTNPKKCEFYHNHSQKTTTLVFLHFSGACIGIYMCATGSTPRLRTSALVVFRKPAQTFTSTHPRHNIKGKRKRDLSMFLEEDKAHTSPHADDKEDDDHHGAPEEEANNTDIVGLTVGVVFMVLLTGVAVVCAVVWRKRMIRHHSRYMARVNSTAKAPLFINKAYTKAENNELEEFPRKHIRFLDHIGKGTFGTVVMAETYNLGKQRTGSVSSRWKVVAVKMTLISEKKNEQLKKDFLSEVALMKSIPPHTNIITLYASCTAHDPYLMILEHAKHGDLRKYLLEHRTERNYANAAYLKYGVNSGRTGNYYSATCGPQYEDKKKKDDSKTSHAKKYTDIPLSDNDLITSRDVLSFALQICRGLDHLTQNKIVHRDVAARNVLVCEHKVVKISDFGLARKVGEQDVYERSTKGLLPIRWMSPEALLYNQYTEKSDVWSFGVLLWELITLGSTPYPGLDSSTILEKIRHRELLICPPHSSAVVNNVMSSCWREDPNMRPSFSQLVQDVETLLESEVEYLDLDQINDHEYSTLD